MSGSEKQIEWAKNILRKTRSLMNLAEELNQNDSRIGKVKEIHKAIISNMEKQNAGDIIKYFKDVNGGISGIPSMVKGQNTTYYGDLMFYIKQFEKGTKKKLR